MASKGVKPSAWREWERAVREKGTLHHKFEVKEKKEEPRMEKSSERCP